MRVAGSGTRVLRVGRPEGPTHLQARGSSSWPLGEETGTGEKKQKWPWDPRVGGVVVWKRLRPERVTAGSFRTATLKVGWTPRPIPTRELATDERLSMGDRRPPKALGTW
jgi:hypothetical protein